jgi:transcriptional regulator with XRE-family HTH domain
MKKIVKFPNLAAEMARNGETQKDLVELLKTNKSTISRKMSGITQWTIADVEIICEHYKKDYYELFK